MDKEKIIFNDVFVEKLARDKTYHEQNENIYYSSFKVES